MGEITRLERRIKSVESVLIFLAVGAIASGDYLYGPHVSLGYLYLIPLSYSALTHRWPATIALVVLCVGLRQWLGPVEYANWWLIARDWGLTGIFLALVTALHRLGTAKGAFFDKAREQRDELVREVKMAAEVQQRLLDQHAPPVGLLDVVARTRPAKVVGGDYYDFIPLEDNRFGIVVADVAGKGLPAALIMPAVQIALRTLAVRYARPSDVLRELNQVFFEALEPSAYVTLFYGVFDVTKGDLEYTNAGHQPVLHRTARTDEITWLSAGGTPVGLLPGAEYETGKAAVEPKDLFVLFTDGVVEARNGNGEEYEQERLVALVRENVDQPAESLVAAIHSSVERFSADGPSGDDVTVIVVRIP